MHSKEEEEAKNDSIDDLEDEGKDILASLKNKSPKKLKNN